MVHGLIKYLKKTVKENRKYTCCFVLFCFHFFCFPFRVLLFLAAIGWFGLWSAGLFLLILPVIPMNVRHPHQVSVHCPPTVQPHTNFIRPLSLHAPTACVISFLLLRLVFSCHLLSCLVSSCLAGCLLFTPSQWASLRFNKEISHFRIL